MNKAEQLVAEFKFILRLRETLETLSEDVCYADGVLCQKDVTDALSAAYDSVSEAIDLIK
jgi:hypothetical protein